jgi:ABC-type amino acid transport substrate-binding protein
MSRRGALNRLTALALLLLAACAAQRAADRPRAPEPSLRVAVPRNSPPYAFWQESRLVGLEVDFARELAAALGRPLALVEIEFTDLIPTLRAGRADLVMAGMTITPARQVLIAFSDPYLRSGLMAGMRREDAARFTSVDKILRTAEPIGVVDGTTADRFVREHAPSASPLVYPSAPAAMDELRQRRVTLVVHDAPVVIWFAAGDEASLAVHLELLNQEQLGWGIRQEDTALREAVNGVLARWRTDGTRERILARWVPYWQRLETRTTGR